MLELKKKKKLIRTTKGAMILPHFRRLVKIITTFEVAIVCALGDAQCRTRELLRQNVT